MKYFFVFVVLTFVCHSEIVAQDLIIINSNDSIPCRIKNIEADSSVCYKAIYGNDIYNGYLKRAYYSQVINDFYTDLKRSSNPNNSLGVFDFGVQYSYFPFHPIIDEYINNEKIFANLSSGFTFSLSYHKFYNPLKKYQNKKGSSTNFSFGLNFDFFSQNVDNNNLQLDDGFNIDLNRQIKTISLLFYYNTNYKYTTYIALKPGLLFNSYKGYYNDTPIKSRSTSLNMGLTIDQKLLEITKRFSIFLSVDQYFLAVKSGQIDYKRLTYYTPIYYNKWQFNYGLTVGLSLKYFY